MKEEWKDEDESSLVASQDFCCKGISMNHACLHGDMARTCYKSLVYVYRFVMPWLSWWPSTLKEFRDVGAEIQEASVKTETLKLPFFINHLLKTTTWKATQDPPDRIHVAGLEEMVLGTSQSYFASSRSTTVPDTLWDTNSST